MKREPQTIKELEKQSVFYHEDDEYWDFDRKKFAELIGREVLNLANRHGNIKPREVMKYFGVEDDTQISNNP